MESKFIILVVFSLSATVGRSFDPQCAEYNGLSEAQSTVLCEIMSNAEAALAAKSDAVNPAYNKLHSLGAVKIGDLTTATDQAESNLNPRGIVSDLISIEYSRTVSNYKFTASIGGVFETVQKSLRRIALGLSVSGNNDVAQVATATNCKAGYRTLLDSIVSVNPDASTMAEVLRESFVTASETIAARYYMAIALALSKDSNYSKALKRIEILQRQTLAEIPDLVESIVKLIRRGKRWNDGIAAEIRTLQKDVTAAGVGYANQTINASKILLRAFHGKSAVNVGDFLSLQILRGEAFFGIRDYTEKTKALRVVALLADSTK